MRPKFQLKNMIYIFYYYYIYSYRIDFLNNYYCLYESFDKKITKFTTYSHTYIVYTQNTN